QPELEYSAARLVRFGPQLSPVSIDDGAAYRQAHACSTGLGGVEGLEDSFEMGRFNTRAGITHGHEHACLILLAAYQQLSRPDVYRAHCFGSIQDEVQDHLLKLNAIPLNGKQSLRKLVLDQDAVPDDRALHQDDYLIDCRVEIKPSLSRRRVLQLLTDAVDDVSGSVGIAHDKRECFLEPHTAPAAPDRGSSGLRDLVTQRGCQFTHHAHSVHVGEIRLHLMQSRQRLRAIFDLRLEIVPTGNTPRVIAKWDAADVKPPIFAVEAPQACFGLIGNTSGD